MSLHVNDLDKVGKNDKNKHRSGLKIRFYLSKGV